jgi:hypothetical protein
MEFEKLLCKELTQLQQEVERLLNLQKPVSTYDSETRWLLYNVAIRVANGQLPAVKTHTDGKPYQLSAVNYVPETDTHYVVYKEIKQ